jgi:serine/threonine protein kinase
VSDEGRLVAGRYRIVQRIGTGAMGAVWQAHDEVLARTVAVKQLLLQPGLEEGDAEDARQRTMREGRIAARLHHPNAITVFDVVTDDRDQPCLIMEYLNSTSLAAVLQEHHTLPPTEVARIGSQVAAALKEAHAVGIVHRDIKPGNILLGGNGTVKITDFGISRAKDDVTVTKTGMIAGTPAYLAPEVAIGGDPGPESDIFSLGSTLYAACEGQPPFGLSENTLSLLHAVAAGQINPPRQSGPLASVLAVLLHPDIHHRPTAEESEELLSAVARGETPLGGPAAATMMAPAQGLLADGTRSFSGDELPGGHSGTLLDNPEPPGGFYDEQDDDYAPATGYPEDDYDGYDHQYESAPPQGGMSATRAVPLAGPYDDEDYDDEPAPPPPARGPHNDRYEDEDRPKAGAWKMPALIGGVVLIAMIGLGLWLFSGNNPAPASQNQPINPSPTFSAPLTPSPSSDFPTTSDTSPTTSATTQQESTSRHTTERQTNSEQPPPPPPVHSTPKTSTPTSTTPSSPDTTPTTPTTPTSQ